MDNEHHKCNNFFTDKNQFICFLKNDLKTNIMELSRDTTNFHPYLIFRCKITKCLEYF